MGRRIAGDALTAGLARTRAEGRLSSAYSADKLFKLPVDIKKSTLLYKLRVPLDLLEAANPGCPEQFKAGDTVSLGNCRTLRPPNLLLTQFHPLYQWVLVSTGRLLCRCAVSSQLWSECAHRRTGA